MGATGLHARVARLNDQLPWPFASSTPAGIPRRTPSDSDGSGGPGHSEALGPPAGSGAGVHVRAARSSSHACHGPSCPRSPTYQAVATNTCDGDAAAARTISMALPPGGDGSSTQRPVVSSTKAKNRSLRCHSCSDHARVDRDEQPLTRERHEGVCAHRPRRRQRAALAAEPMAQQGRVLGVRGCRHARLPSILQRGAARGPVVLCDLAKRERGGVPLERAFAAALERDRPAGGLDEGSAAGALVGAGGGEALRARVVELGAPGRLCRAPPLHVARRHEDAPRERQREEQADEPKYALQHPNLIPENTRPENGGRGAARDVRGE